MKGKNDVDVLINGRKYTICGFESGDYLQKVASYINEKYADLKSRDYYNSLDLDLKNVLLAINIADDYFKVQKRTQEQTAESELKDKTMFEMKHEIIELQSKLEEKEEELKKLRTPTPPSSGVNRNRR